MFSSSTNLIVTSSVMGCLAIVAVALRLWAGEIRRMRRGADDILIIIGLILALGLCICNIVGAALFRLGDHELYLEPGPPGGRPHIESDHLEGWLLLGYAKIIYSIQLLHATAMPVIKASLMLFLRRIFGHVKAFRITFWVVGVYIFLWWLTTFWMSVFRCWPVSLNWNITPNEMGKCIPNFEVWYSSAALLNVVSDVIIITVPIPLVWRLQMPLQQRLVTISILTTAIIVIIAGIGRTVAYFTYNRGLWNHSTGFYYIFIWTSIEPCLGVVGCCLPTLGPLVDLKYSAIYSEIKCIFSRQALLAKSFSEASGNRPGQRTAWVELTNGRHNVSQPMVRYAATIDVESVGDDLPTAHKYGLASADQHV